MSHQTKKMSLGIQPTCWTNDDFPELRNETPYQVILDETKAAGFEGGSTGHNYPVHLPSLMYAIGSRQLKITSTWVGTQFTTGQGIEASFDAFETQVAFLKSVKAKDVVVAELDEAVNQVRIRSVLSARPKFNGPQWYLLTSLLNRAGKYAHSHGMQLSYHPHVGTGVMTIEESERLLHSTDPEYVGLCLDTAHLRFGGASASDIVHFAKKYSKRIKHVHLKNVRQNILSQAVTNDISFYQAIEDGIFTVPGGEPNEDKSLLVPVLQILQDVSYDRWLVVEAEQDPTKPDPISGKLVTPLEYAKMARKFLLNHLGY